MRPHARIVTLTVTVLLAVGAGPAAAAILTVNTLDDNSGQGDQRCSLREAIAAVNSPGTAGSDCKPAAFGANTIVMPAGTYTVASHIDPTTQELGELVVASTVTNLTIEGAGESRTTVAARPTLFDRLLKVSPGATVILKDLTLTGGRAPSGDVGAQNSGGDGGQGANGGAILNGGSLTLIDSAVTNSRAGDGGPGGVGFGVQPLVANGGPGGAGGAGGFGGGIYNTGTLTLQGSTIAGNIAGTGGAGGQGGDGTSTGGVGGEGGPGGAGGGVSNAGGTLTVVDSTFKGNEAGAGGRGGSGGPGPTGGAGGDGGSGRDGGGVLSSGGTLSITNSTFASNSAGRGGAGGYGAGGGAVTGANGNPGGGGNGGGIDVLGVGSYSLESVTVAGNVAGGGGPALLGGSGTPTGPTGPVGASGGIFSQGANTTIQNSLFASNSAGNCSGSVVDSGHNLSFAGAGCPATFATADPDLGPLQSNGGPAQTISLGPGSAAINKVPSTGAGCPATDERGVHRPSGSGCDIGAYEVAPPKATVGNTRSVTSSGATLTASVTPNAGAATVQFQFGTSKKYKSKTAVQHVGGVDAVTVTAKLKRLRQGTRYHYRVVVVAPDGTIRGQDRTFKTTNRPTLTRLSVKPAAFRAGGSGATITYVDSEAATTTFTVLRCSKQLAHGARCARFVKVGGFSHRDHAGQNKVPLRARIGGRTLSAGTYQLKATPRKARKTGNTSTAKFQILG
jgi:CSLREA domain-containing protein